MLNTDSQKIISKIYDHYRDHGHVVSTDSRRDLSAHGGVFFALSGERFDGNDFALSALENGASMAVVDRALMGALDGRIVVVDNVLQALGEVASLHRAHLTCPIVALTGSNGKTTTKELITRVLSRTKKVGATKGNLNNHIGVPLTLLSFDESVEVGVVEMGANHIGEIEQLCRIARPTCGLITNIGVAHLEGFGSIEGVRKAKGELYNYLVSSGGIVLYNAEDQTLSQMVMELDEPRTVGYTSESFGIRNVELDEDGYLQFDYQRQRVQTSIIGLYNIHNIEAAMAIGQLFGLDSTMSIAMIASYVSDNNRSQRIETQFNTIILDAYNANPSSMGSAIDNFVVLSSQQPKVVILGDMKELGAESLQLHKELIDKLVGAGLGQVIGVGQQMSEAIQGRSDLALSFLSVEQLAAFLKVNPLNNNLILIKGSRSMGMEKIVELL